ncbi:MAG: hypothetical protein HQM14_15160 [SAR324 cluster bacterium]|nr:hypothetical protein [SAR324 cluster bacterium]
MPCKHTKSLQASAITSPNLLGSEQWKSHLDACQTCYEEANYLDKSLELYLQLEKNAVSKLPNLEMWEQIEQKVNGTSHSINFVQWRKGLAAAAVVAVLIGMSLWWKQSISVNSQPTFLNVTSNLTMNHQISEIEAGKPFGPPSAYKQIIWTNEQFGISIENKSDGNYSTISIGTRLPKEYAHTSFPGINFSSELAIVEQKASF